MADVVAEVSAVSAGKPDADAGDGGRLLARGVELELAGKTRRLVFTYEAIEYVENRFGTLQAFLEAVQGVKGAAVVSGITACLLHEFDAIASPSEVDELRRHVQRNLRVKDFQQNFEILWRAIEESLPNPEPAAGPKAPGSRGGSHGAGSSTLRMGAASAASSSGAQHRRSSARSSKRRSPR